MLKIFLKQGEYIAVTYCREPTSAGWLDWMIQPPLEVPSNPYDSVKCPEESSSDHKTV